MPEVRLSHPDKILFADDGITKAELAEHYARVAQVMVPHTRDRPMNLWRWNGGIAGERVVQQALPKGAPDWVARCEVPRRRGGSVVHGMINDAETLRWLAQQNCITPHIWNSRCDRRDRPDRMVFDLDPTGEDFADVRAGALATADLLRELGLEPFALVTGSRGIHIVAPLKRTRVADEVRAAAGAIAERIAASHPDTLTTAWRKASATAASSSTSPATPMRRPSSRRTRFARCRARRSRCRSAGTRSQTPRCTRSGSGCARSASACASAGTHGRTWPRTPPHCPGNWWRADRRRTHVPPTRVPS